GEHSYGCPFGPPRIAEVWQHQRSWFGPNGQPPESSQLALAPPGLSKGLHRRRNRPDLAQHHEQIARAIEHIARRQAEHADRVPPIESSGAKKAPRERG